MIEDDDDILVDIESLTSPVAVFDPEPLDTIFPSLLNGALGQSGSELDIGDSVALVDYEEEEILLAKTISLSEQNHRQLIQKKLKPSPLKKTSKNNKKLSQHAHDINHTVNNTLNQQIPTPRWTENEDLLLLKGIEQHGFGKWSLISKKTFVRSRSAMQCKARAKHLKEIGRIDGKSSNATLAGAQSPSSSGNEHIDSANASVNLSPKPEATPAEDDDEDELIDIMETSSSGFEFPTATVSEPRASLVTEEPSVKSELLEMSDISEASDIDIDDEQKALSLAQELTDAVELKSSSPVEIKTELPVSEMKIKKETEKNIVVKTEDIETKQAVESTPSSLPKDTITNDEILGIPDWFPLSHAHPRQLQTRTPQRYLSIRNAIMGRWNNIAAAPGPKKFMTKTAARKAALKVVSCDVHAISKIYDFLNDNDYINTGLERRPRRMSSTLVEKSKAKKTLTLTEKQLSDYHAILSAVGDRRNRRVRDPETGEWMLESELDGRTISHVDTSDADDLKPKKRQKRTHAGGDLGLLSTIDNEHHHHDHGSYLEDPFQLIQCKSVDDVKQQFGFSPHFNIRISANAMALMDAHSHMFSDEIIGLMGGKIIMPGSLTDDGFKATIDIQCIYPCQTAHSTEIQCEMDPMSELAAREYFHSQGLRVVGWYHSHPTFQTSPSKRDIQTQSLWQHLFQLKLQQREGRWNILLDEKEAETQKDLLIVEPFVGVIVSPYGNADTSQSDMNVIHILPQSVTDATEEKAYTPNYQIYAPAASDLVHDLAKTGLDKVFSCTPTISLKQDHGKRQHLLSSIQHWLSQSQSQQPQTPQATQMFTDYINAAFQ